MSWKKRFTIWVNGCSLIAVIFLVPLSARAEEVQWTNYQEPFRQSLRVLQHGSHEIEGADVIVNLPSSFLDSHSKIVIAITLESNTKGGFEAFAPHIRVNKALFKTHRIPVKPMPYKQTQQVSIESKQLKVGKNILKFSFMWKNENVGCSETGCGYEIQEISFQDAPRPTPTPTPVPPTPTPRPTSVPTPTPMPTPTPSHIPELLKEANGYFGKRQYLTPKKKNAFDVYKEILRLDAKNLEAREKLGMMLKEYKTLGDQNYTQTKYDKARIYYERYASVAEYVVNTLQDSTIMREYQTIQDRMRQLKTLPTPTPTYTPTPVETTTPTPVETTTPTPTATPTQLEIPTPTITPTPTAIPTEFVFPTATPTESPTPTAPPTLTVTTVPMFTPSPISTAPDVQQFIERQGKIYAIIIGIETYRDQRIPVRQFAANDARELADLFANVLYGAVPPEQMQLIVNQDATDRSLKKALGKWLRPRVKAEDTILIYYSGYAAIEEQQLYWMMYDSDAEDMYSSALSQKKLLDILHRVPSQHVMLVLDVCYYPATASRQQTEQTTFDQIQQFQEAFSREGYVVISVSDGTQCSTRLSDQQHRLFAYHLLGGLKGIADDNNDGSITADEIGTYLNHQVSQATGGEIVPQMIAPSANPLAGIPITFNVSLLQKKAQEQQLEAQRNRLLEIYQAGEISKTQYEKAIAILATNDKDQILEDFLTEKISLDLFKEIF